MLQSAQDDLPAFLKKFYEIFENHWKSLEVFGHFRKSSENSGNCLQSA